MCSLSYNWDVAPGGSDAAGLLLLALQPLVPQLKLTDDALNLLPDAYWTGHWRLGMHSPLPSPLRIPQPDSILDCSLHSSVSTKALYLIFCHDWDFLYSKRELAEAGIVLNLFLDFSSGGITEELDFRDGRGYCADSDGWMELQFVWFLGVQFPLVFAAGLCSGRLLVSHPLWPGKLNPL